MIHQEPSPLAGQTVAIISGHFEGMEYVVEDWWDRVAGKSWMWSDGNPAAMFYGIRSAKDELPTDNQVLYGKIGASGYLLHISEVQAGREADA